MDDCLFCKIVAGNIPSTKIYEDETVFSFLDIGPNNPGHTLVIPKEHFESIHDLPKNTLSSMTSAAQMLAGAIKKGVKADGINFAMNNGKAAGQVIFHAHLHVIPRHEGDGIKPWKAGSYDSDEQREKVAENIIKEL